MSRLALSVFLACSVAACSGTSEPTQSGDPTKPGPTTDPGTKTGDPDAPLDPSTNDPVPVDLPSLVAHAASGADLAPDFSCAGKPMPVEHGATKDREFHLIELGGQDTDRVGDVPVELFFANKLGKADASLMAPKSDDATQNGLFHANTHGGFIGYRIAAQPGYVSIVGLDLDVPESGPVLPAVPTVDRVKALSILIAGSAYDPTPGTGRVVVRIVDCNTNAVAGAHVTLEVDGKVVKPGKNDGVRRNYFSDSELPGDDTLTSRSGVVAFLEVPGDAKTIRVVARGKVGSDTQVIAKRSVPLVADGVLTAKAAPWKAP
ncbi:MAG: hypothetical protein ACXWUG_12345 [Polyangiales bacterium]